MRNKYRIRNRVLGKKAKTEKITRIRRRDYGLSILKRGESRRLLVLERATRQRTQKPKEGPRVVWCEIARREGTRGKVIFAGA